MKKVDEIFRIIEEKIKASGYQREVSGEQVYIDISNQIDGKENGTYLLLSKFLEDVTFEYQLAVLDEEFDLKRLLIHAPEGEFSVEFDD